MSEHLAPDADRQARLKGIIKRLHDGESASAVRRDFHDLIMGVSAEEVAAMEQSLIDEGFPVEEIQRLCEVHVEVFRGALGKGGTARKMPGHPVHSLLAENREAARRLRALLGAARSWAWGRAGDPRAAERAGAALAELARIEVHYARKENQLFPLLERHGFTGPSKVMWGKHDEIRAQIKAAGAALGSGARPFRAEARKLAGMMRRMFFMEERILVPNALKRLSEREWAEMRSGEEAIGFAWIKPGAEYDAGIVLDPSLGKPKDYAALAAASEAAAGGAPTEAASAAAPGRAASAVPAGAGLVDLSVGRMSLEVLDLALKSLNVDFSVVDENDRVLYYSDSPDRVFPRSPAIIGRAVQNCHPPKSVATVERILDAFKRGERDEAKFWIEVGGKFVVIEYRALRDASGAYRGTLEISQDATSIRALQGQRRLLDWA